MCYLMKHYLWSFIAKKLDLNFIRRLDLTIHFLWRRRKNILKDTVGMQSVRSQLRKSYRTKNPVFSISKVGACVGVGWWAGPWQWWHQSSPGVRDWAGKNGVPVGGIRGQAGWREPLCGMAQGLEPRWGGVCIGAWWVFRAWVGVGGGNSPARVSEPNQVRSVLMAGASREQGEVGVWSVARGVGAPGGRKGHLHGGGGTAEASWGLFFKWAYPLISFFF